MILVGNKVDLMPKGDFTTKFDIDEDILFISSKENENMDTLKEVMLRTVLDENVQ